MGIDRLKLASTIKIFVFFAYLIHFSISNTSLIKLYENKAVSKLDAEIKRELSFSKCLLLLGGSNVRMGLSAESVSTKSCEALNLGINSEGGRFEKYLNWLNKNISANKVIYSPALIWQDSSLINNNEAGVLKFPNIAISSIIKIFFSTVENTTTPEYNKFGDEIKYQCLNDFPSFSIKINDFTKSNYLINQAIYNRVYSLKGITNSDEIFVRVPPVYVKSDHQAKLYTKLMNGRVEMLKELGVKIVGSTIVSTNSSLFCDSFHPNANGRELFSKEIVLP